MPLSIFKSKSPSGTVGLDIDGSLVAVAQLGELGIERAATADIDPGIVRDGEVHEADALADALKNLFRREQLPRRVRLGVANQQIVVRTLELPRIADEREREAAVRFQTAEAVAMPLNEAVIDYQQTGERTDAEGRTTDAFVVVAAREEMTMRLVRAVRSAGLRPEGIDLSAFALVRTLAGAAAGAPENAARVYVHLGGVTNLALATGSTCLFTRPLAASVDDPESGPEALAEEMRL
jgi:type IV pilus assembly protein PilM